MRSAATIGRAAVAAAASILVLGAAGCAGSPAPPAAAGAGAPASQPSASAAGSGPAAVLPACSVLMRGDVLAVAAAFPHDTIAIDGHEHSSDPPTNECSFNQKGVFTGSDGITVTLSGDHWAKLTVVTGGASYAFNPAEGTAVTGLGGGAYWTSGDHTVVIRHGRDVLQVVDEVPVNPDASPGLVAAYQQAARALATRILSRL
jgi:hypothetical protein